MVQGTSFSCVQDTRHFGPGLVCSGLDEKTEGWIVWVSRLGDKLSVTTYSHIVSVSDSTTFGIGRKVVPDRVVGGFYVKPVYPSVGVICFELVGLMDKFADGWKVVPFSADSFSDNPVLVPSNKPTIVPEKPKLVPAGNKNESEEPNAEVPSKDKKNKKEKKSK